MPRDRLPGGKGWGPQLVERDLSIHPPGEIRRRFVAPVKEEPSMAQDTQPAAAAEPHKEPTPHQVHVWETVQRVGTVAAAAKELRMLHSGVTSALAGYMKNKGIKGPIPGIGGHVASAADEQPSIGVIRPGRVLPVADLPEHTPGPSFSDVDKPDDDDDTAEVSAREDGLTPDGTIIDELRAEASTSRADQDVLDAGESPEDHPLPADAQPTARWSATVADAAGEPIWRDVGEIGRSWRDGLIGGARPTDLAPLRRSLAAARSDRVLDLHPIVLGSIEWMAEHASLWTADQRAAWMPLFERAVLLAYPGEEAA